MSGISQGSRLDQLVALRARLDVEIAAERRRLDACRPPAPETWQPAGGNRVDRRLTDLGVTAREVKEWAVARGLLDLVRRGRVAEHLVEAYALDRGPS